MIVDEKRNLRSKMTGWRQALDGYQVEEQSIALSACLLDELDKLQLSNRQKVIGLYRAFRNEADIGYAISGLSERGWGIAYPLILTSKNRSTFTDLPSSAGLVFIRIDTPKPIKSADHPEKSGLLPDHADERLLENLTPGHFGVSEPPTQPDRVVVPNVIVLPGLAFDKEGNRLGWGKGYYDRYLSDLANKPICWGAALNGQVIERVPADRTDQKIDAVLTPNGLIHMVK